MQNDVNSLSDPAVRKPILRVQPGGDVLVDLPAVTPSGIARVAA